MRIRRWQRESRSTGLSYVLRRRDSNPRPRPYKGNPSPIDPHPTHARIRRSATVLSLMVITVTVRPVAFDSSLHLSVNRTSDHRRIPFELVILAAKITIDHDRLAFKRVVKLFGKLKQRFALRLVDRNEAGVLDRRHPERALVVLRRDVSIDLVQ